MKPRVFFDTDVILDYLLAREGFPSVMEILQKGVDLEIEMCTSFLTMSNVADYIHKYSSKAATPILNQLLSFLEILPVEETQFRDALLLSGADTEIKLQIVCAVRAKCTHIVTRRPQLYRIDKDSMYYWNLPIIATPEQL